MSNTPMAVPAARPKILTCIVFPFFTNSTHLFELVGRQEHQSPDAFLDTAIEGT
ncbi:hypothetical protein ACI2K4_14700 [Micromonospora sp. NPDC050397]|uniref:hypothetical protein n=1 Tax=Micromonospora sp. NPDC050397 TaxID=3364279 RepID=UPI00384D660F